MIEVPKNIQIRFPKVRRHNAKDYANAKIGKVVPIYRVKNLGKSIAWLAKCDCGEFTVVRADNLRKNKLTACRSCLLAEKNNVKTFRQEGVPQRVLDKYPERPLGTAFDRHGERFGKLTALYRTEPVSETTWLCECSCGNHEAVRTGYLTQGIAKSCKVCYGQPFNTPYNELPGDRIPEQLLKEYIAEVSEKMSREYPIKPIGAASNIIGQTFGELTPLYRTENLGGVPMFLAKCTCGGYSVVNSGNISDGSIASCGCGSESIGESIVYKALEKAGIEFEKEYSFSDLTGVDNKTKLRYDAAVFDNGDLSYLTEYDGQQHYEDNGFFNKRLEKIQERDEEKNSYSRANGIPLIRIPYTDLTALTLKDLKLGSKYTIK